MERPERRLPLPARKSLDRSTPDWVAQGALAALAVAVLSAAIFCAVWFTKGESQVPTSAQPGPPPPDAKVLWTSAAELAGNDAAVVYALYAVPTATSTGPWPAASVSYPDSFVDGMANTDTLWVLRVQDGAVDMITQDQATGNDWTGSTFTLEDVSPTDGKPDYKAVAYASSSLSDLQQEAVEAALSGQNTSTNLPAPKAYLVPADETGELVVATTPVWTALKAHPTLKTPALILSFDSTGSSPAYADYGLDGSEPAVAAFLPPDMVWVARAMPLTSTSI